jgi:hypothetical protein
MNLTWKNKRRKLPKEEYLKSVNFKAPLFIGGPRCGDHYKAGRGSYLLFPLGSGFDKYLKFSMIWSKHG